MTNDDSEMSEGRYQEQCGLVDDMRAESGASLDAPVGRWQVMSGAMLYIARMTDDHLANAVVWCERRAFGHHPKCDELHAEQRRRADC